MFDALNDLRNIETAIKAVEKDGTLAPEALLPPETKSRERLGSGVATEFRIEVHGESYEVAVTGSGDSGAGRRKRSQKGLDTRPRQHRHAWQCGRGSGEGT